MNSVLRDSSFDVDPTGHGGNRRTAQIAELVELAGFLVDDIKATESTRLSRYSSGIRFLIKHSFKIAPLAQLIGICGYHILRYQETLNKHGDTKLVLWENTGNHLLPYVFKEHGFKVVALPHNLESLVGDKIDYFTKQAFPKSLKNEIKHLASSDAIFCISREEQWLMKIHGVNADFLPYYPPKPILDALLKVRAERSLSSKTRFLILGTAHNAPTLLGMVEQINWLIESRADIEVDVAGYGTEQLQSCFNDPKLNILGAVDSSKLSHLMASAKALLVHQQAGAGALTRIPEAIIAGIPVIANSNACRSAFEYHGIHCYENKIELTALLEKSLDTPSTLHRPQAAEERFINCIKMLAASS